MLMQLLFVLEPHIAVNKMLETLETERQSARLTDSRHACT